jgi:hypothetical protein
VDAEDTATQFAISNYEEVGLTEIEMRLTALRDSWSVVTPRQYIPDADWIMQLTAYISELVDLRVNHVRLWLNSNLERFQVGHAAVEELHRRFDNMVIEMKSNIQLCRAQCTSCHLLCVRSRRHVGEHSCETTHKCVHNCAFCGDVLKPCGTSCVLRALLMTVS